MGKYDIAEYAYQISITNETFLSWANKKITIKCLSQERHITREDESLIRAAYCIGYRNAIEQACEALEEKESENERI